MIRTMVRGFGTVSLSLAFALLSGCGGGGGAAGGGPSQPPSQPTNRAPSVQAFSVTPKSLPFDGGKVIYSITAADADNDTLTVTVTVTRPDGGIQILSSKTGAPGVFAVDFTSPGNISAAGQIVTYNASVRVSDGVNAPVIVSGATYTVSPPAGGPPPSPPPVRP